MNKVADVLVAVIFVAIVLVATRPGSMGPEIIGASTSGFANILKAATGQAGGSASRAKRQGKDGNRRKVSR